MGDAGGLRLYSQSQFPSSVSRSLVACCPTIDISATVGGDEDVLFIRRSNGELVSRQTERGQKIQALRWKVDGQFLAVGWSDGVVRLMGLENTKAVHHIPITRAQPDSTFTYIGWSRSLTGKRKPLWKDVLSNGQDPQQDEALLDLPHELTFVEVDIALPKISPLPVAGGSGEDMFVFSTRNSLEFVFQPPKHQDNNTVDVMLVGCSDSTVHLNIYDTFTIGTFKVDTHTMSRASGDGIPLRLLQHASNPQLSTYSLLMAPPEASAGTLYLVPMDLTFISSSPINLSLLASKTTTLQKLLRYIKQTQIHILGEWQSARELPGRFLMSIQGELEEKPTGCKNIAEALYHTVLSGHTFPEVKEWLVDRLAERGHKRWDKGVTSGLEGLRDLVHQNMMPALDRCYIILSRLLGIAKYNRGKAEIGFTAAQITKLLDIMSCLKLVCTKILAHVTEELDLFAVFSSWLRLEIDVLASSSQTDELSEKEATIDHGKVLAYIRNHLMTSPIGKYFDKVKPEDWTKDFDLLEDGPSLLDMLDKQLQRERRGLPHMKAFPQPGFLIEYLSKNANSVFENIAEAERRSVRFGQPIKLDMGSPVARHDVRMAPLPRAGQDNLDGRTFTAVTSSGHPSHLYLFSTAIKIINGISSAFSTTAVWLSLGDKGTVLDIKFLSDETLLVLWTPKDNSSAYLVAIPTQSSLLDYTQYGGDSTSMPIVSISEEEFLSAFWSVAVPGDARFSPLQMEVASASTARGDVPARLCVLGRDRAAYRVFALPDERNMVRS